MDMGESSSESESEGDSSDGSDGSGEEEEMEIDMPDTKRKEGNEKKVHQSCVFLHSPFSPLSKNTFFISALYANQLSYVGQKKGWLVYKRSEC